MSKYDAVISWGLPVEELFAFFFAKKHVNIKPATRFSGGQSSEDVPADQLEGCKRVAVLGTYLSEVDHVRKTLGDSGVIHSYTYGDADPYKDVADCVFDLSECFGMLREKYPWISHIIDRDTGKATVEDEVFYRGMCAELKTGETLGDIIGRVANGEVTPKSVMDRGEIIQECQAQLAGHAVKCSGLEVKINKYSGRLVSGAWNMVLPVAAAAAVDYDVGINMRFNPKTGNTHFTFFTTDPDRVDLSFVDSPPFSGGGKKQCKGCTVPAQVLIDRAVDLETMVARAQSTST